MRITNEPGGSGPTGAFAEMFRLQADFQSRLAEETLRYLRRLQGAVVPAAPGTVVIPGKDAELRAEAAAGTTATLSLEIENLQRVHCMVTPQLTPLVSASGVTWFPLVENATASKLLPPGTVETLPITFEVPAGLPGGEYRGALVLQGFRSNSLGVLVSVGSKGGVTKTTKAETSAATPETKVAAKSVRKDSPKKSASKSNASKSTGPAKQKTARKRASKKSRRTS
jgi:hypothetical protein